MGRGAACPPTPRPFPPRQPRWCPAEAQRGTRSLAGGGHRRGRGWHSGLGGQQTPVGALVWCRCQRCAGSWAASEKSWAHHPPGNGSLPSPRRAARRFLWTGTIRQEFVGDSEKTTGQLAGLKEARGLEGTWPSRRDARARINLLLPRELSRLLCLAGCSLATSLFAKQSLLLEGGCEPRSLEPVSLECSEREGFGNRLSPPAIRRPDRGVRERPCPLQNIRLLLARELLDGTSLGFQPRRPPTFSELGALERSTTRPIRSSLILI